MDQGWIDPGRLGQKHCK